MGGACGRLNRRRTVVVIGLDSSGKSAIVANFADKETDMPVSDVSSTPGLKLEHFHVAGVNWKCWDMGGQGRYRALWPSYYRHCDAIVFVVDRLDTARVGVVREEFRNMIEHKDVRSKSHPILVLLNKSDCPPAAGEKALSQAQLQKLISYDAARNLHAITFAECSGVTGDGLGAAFQWLGQQV